VVEHPPIAPPPHPVFGVQATPCAQPVGVDASGQSVWHWKWPVGSQLQVFAQPFEPAAAEVAQPLPILQAAPGAQAGGLGGEGGQVALHWKCPELSQEQELVHPFGIPLPQPEPGLHGAPGVAQVPGEGGDWGGQISVTHLPSMIA
jgi:hypothetical protein